MVNDVYYGPLKVGDWATWFSAVGTLLAVCVAIFIPMRQTCRLRKERLDQEARIAQILAIELAELFPRLRRDMIDRRLIIQCALDRKFDGVPVSFVTSAKLGGDDGLPHGADLLGLPYPIAPCIAALRSTLCMYDGSIERTLALTDKLPLHQIVEMTKLQAMLDACQGALARAASQLQRYEPSYSLVDYLDKEDGTRVKKLVDY